MQFQDKSLFRDTKIISCWNFSRNSIYLGISQEFVQKNFWKILKRLFWKFLQNFLQVFLQGLPRIYSQDLSFVILPGNFPEMLHQLLKRFSKEFNSIFQGIFREILLCIPAGGSPVLPGIFKDSPRIFLWNFFFFFQVYC